MEHDKTTDKEGPFTAEEVARAQPIRALPPIETELMASIPGQRRRIRKGPRRNIEWSEELGRFVKKWPL